MPKVLIMTGDAAEDLEVFYPYQRLLEEGYEVDIAAPSVKKLQFVVHDFVDGFDTYTEKPGHSWPSDVAFSDVDPADYVALVVPGGRAPEYIRNDPDAKRIVAHFFENDAPVARPAVTGRGRCAAGPPQRRLSGARRPRRDGRRHIRGRPGRGGRQPGQRPGVPDHPQWFRPFIEQLRKVAPAG